MESLTKKQFDSIRWEGLSDLVFGALKVRVPLKANYLAERGRIDIESSMNLVDFGHCGIFSAVFEDVRVDNFGGGLCEDGTLWLPMHLTWTSRNRGTNGSTFLEVYYNFKTHLWSKNK
jgi:hypothetical protein